MKRFEVSEEQLEDLTKTALSGGVEQVWSTMQAWLSKQEAEVAEGFAAKRQRREEAAAVAKKENRAGDPFENDAIAKLLGKETLADREAAELAKIAAARATPQPVWQEISGLYRPEYAMTPGERAGRIRKLLRAVERVARAELRAEETRCGGDWRALRNLQDEDGEADGRCFAWDPLRSICYYFGIAKTKLGAYAWEIWGLSGPQIVDRVKCESVREVLRAEVKTFVEAHYKEHPASDAEDVWAALREQRKGLAHRTALAARLGFSSYARYFRACVLCHGIEPGALEREIFEEVMTGPCAVVKQETEVGSREGAEAQREDVGEMRPKWEGGWPGDRAG